MVNIPHISSLYANPWVAWVMFVLLVVALFNPQARLVGVTWHGVFSHSERAYSVRARDWSNEISLRVFRLGVMAMALFLLVIPTETAQLIVFMKVLGIVAIIYTLQLLLLHGVGYVFVPAKRMAAAMEQYSNIRTLMCVGLYPILLLLTNIPSPIFIQVACAIVLILFIVVLLGKSIQLFYTTPMSILYILLYIIFLELLPLMVSISAIQYFV